MRFLAEGYFLALAHEHEFPFTGHRIHRAAADKRGAGQGGNVEERRAAGDFHIRFLSRLFRICVIVPFSLAEYFNVETVAPVSLFYFSPAGIMLSRLKFRSFKPSRAQLNITVFRTLASEDTDCPASKIERKRHSPLKNNKNYYDMENNSLYI
jgi:hypothetical protein